MKTQERECVGCDGRGWIMYQRGPDEVTKDICMDCEGKGTVTVEVERGAEPQTQEGK